MSELPQVADESSFWMVWNPQRYAPTYRHTTAESALTEAKRLARNNPSQKFYVLQAIGLATIPEPPVHVIKLASDVDADIPF